MFGRFSPALCSFVCIGHHSGPCICECVCRSSLKIAERARTGCLFFQDLLSVISRREITPLVGGSLPPYFGFTAAAKVVTAKKRKTAYRRKIKNYRHTLVLPPPPKPLPPKNEKPPTAKKLPPYGITAQKVPPPVIPPTKVPPCLSSQKRWLCAS